MYEPTNEAIQSVIISDDMQTELDNLKLIINDATLGVEISPLSIFCQKTGHVIAEREKNAIFSLTKNMGKNAIIPALYNSPGLNIHPLWMETAGRNLDDLMKLDPVGYAVYCFGLLTADFYQTPKNYDKKRSPWAEKYWAMARANALLTQRGVADLTELNLELCRCIIFMPDSSFCLFTQEIKRTIARTPDALAMLHCAGELTQKLKNATNKTLDSIGVAKAWKERTRFLDYPTTPADAARGPSNVRQQKRAKINIEDETNFSALAALFKASGVLDELNRVQTEDIPGTGAWQIKLRERASAREKSIEAGLAALSNLNFDEISADNDTDDNEVEVRRLAIPTPEGAAPTFSDQNDHENHEQFEADAIEIAEIEKPLTIDEFSQEAQIFPVAAEITNPLELKVAQEELKIAPVMAEIAKQVLEVMHVPAELQKPFEIEPKKPLSALELLRAKKKGL